MFERDVERNGSSLFGSARVDGDLRSLNQCFNLFDAKIILFDGAEDLLNLCRFCMCIVFNRGKFLENPPGGYREGFFRAVSSYSEKLIERGEKA
ncbi:MAG: hypothetical protein QW261_09670 [Candidatus Jordarchaeaceae archaeon]